MIHERWLGAALAMSIALLGCAEIDTATSEDAEVVEADEAIDVRLDALTGQYSATTTTYGGGVDANGIGVFLSIADNTANAYFYVLPPGKRTRITSASMTIGCLSEAPPRFMRSFTKTFDPFTIDLGSVTRNLTATCTGRVRSVTLNYSY